MKKTLSIFIVFFVGMLRGEILYVDPLASGAGNGSSWTDAWTSFAAITWGSGAGNVSAGDTLYISGGATSQTYTTTLTVGASGTVGNTITISVGQEAGHNGMIIQDFDAGGDSGTSDGVSALARSYIHLTGNYGGVSKWTIKNTRNTASSSTCSAIQVSSATNFRASYITVDNCNNGFRGTTGTGYEVDHCDMTNMRGDSCISFSACTGSWDSNLSHHNTLGIAWNNAGGNGGPDGHQVAHGASIYNNTIRVDQVAFTTSTGHPDSVQTLGNYVKIYNNTFINTGDSCIDSDASYFNLSPHDIWIFNNVFRIDSELDPYPEFIRFYNCNVTLEDVKVWNNTFANDGDGTDCYINAGSACTASGIEFRNNIWTNCDNTILLIAGASFSSGNFSITNNVYNGTSATISFLGASTSAASWVSGSDPDGFTASPTFIDSGTFDFRLATADTIARGNGVDLSASFTTDKNGTTRSSWDLGAYEYVQTEYPPARASRSAAARGVGVN